jgi:hypothetical protein
MNTVDTSNVEATSGGTLRNAAGYLAEHGWIQGAYYDATIGVFTPPACLVGALGVVCYGGPADSPVEQFGEPGFEEFGTALAVLEAFLTDWCGDPPDGGEVHTAYAFNDAKGRTLAEVTEALKLAARTVDGDWPRWDDLADGEATVFRGVLHRVQVRTSQQGHRYAEGVLDTGKDWVPIHISPEVWTGLHPVVRGAEFLNGKTVRLYGRADRRPYAPLFLVEAVRP